ncbi:MAG TPA: helix-turn-helix domain-containing protein [Spirochaetota bacterium]|nr:helix-turn-helix domain-containing protein [Spirochaetota bacterium]
MILQIINSVSGKINLVICIILAIFSLLQLIHKNKTAVNYLLSLCFFSVSYTLLAWWALHFRYIYYAPLLIHGDIVAILLIGPSFYLYFRALLNPDISFNKLSLLHFLAPACAAAFTVTYQLIDHSMVEWYLSVRPDTHVYRKFPVFNAMKAASFLSIAIYFALSANMVHRIIKISARHIKYLRFMMLINIFLSIISLFLVIAQIALNKILIVTLSTILEFIGVCYFLFSYSYPEIAQTIYKRISNTRSADSLPETTDVDGLVARITQLMESHKIYRNSELTLQSLSIELGLNNHIVSLILNDRMNMNFRSFVNLHRIREAKELLLRNSEMSILEIAYTVGFNSKSSFNDAFKKDTGLSPSDFRDKYSI